MSPVIPSSADGAIALQNAPATRPAKSADRDRCAAAPPRSSSPPTAKTRGSPSAVVPVTSSHVAAAIAIAIAAAWAASQAPAARRPLALPRERQQPHDDRQHVVEIARARGARGARLHEGVGAGRRGGRADAEHQREQPRRGLGRPRPGVDRQEAGADDDRGDARFERRRQQETAFSPGMESEIEADQDPERGEPDRHDRIERREHVPRQDAQPERPEGHPEQQEHQPGPGRRREAERQTPPRRRHQRFSSAITRCVPPPETPSSTGRSAWACAKTRATSSGIGASTSAASVMTSPG